MTEHTKPTQETRAADRAAMDAPHGAVEELTPEVEEAAERNSVSPETPQHYQEMTERGANQEGEGRIA